MLGSLYIFFFNGNFKAGSKNVQKQAFDRSSINLIYCYKMVILQLYISKIISSGQLFFSY